MSIFKVASVRSIAGAALAVVVTSVALFTSEGKAGTLSHARLHGKHDGISLVGYSVPLDNGESLNCGY